MDALTLESTEESTVKSLVMGTAMLGLLAFGDVAIAGDGNTGYCGGEVVGIRYAKDGYGNLKGSLVVRYNSSTGKVCAVMNRKGTLEGRRGATAVSLTNANTGALLDIDFNYYYWFAGPVRASAIGRCVRANGRVFANGTDSPSYYASMTVCR